MELCLGNKNTKLDLGNKNTKLGLENKNTKVGLGKHGSDKPFHKSHKVVTCKNLEQNQPTLNQILPPKSRY